MKIRSNEDLVKYINKGKRPDFIYFWGHRKGKNIPSKTCFSQWYDAPFKKDGDTFLTAEHYMMFAKARLFNDKAAALKVLQCRTPKEAKAVGRGVSGFDSEKWDREKFAIVVEANMAKFSQNKDLKSFLLRTKKKVLVEASPVDPIWGVGLAEDNPNIHNPKKWKGLNLLGYALMEVRENLEQG